MDEQYPCRAADCAGAMAAALASMVAAASRGKKAYARFEAELSAALAKLNVLGEELRASIDADAESYRAVVAATKARKLARDLNRHNLDSQELDSQEPARQEPASRDLDAEVANSLRQAAGVPLSVAQRAAELCMLVQELGPRTNPNMASDLKTALALARAAVEGALANVEINLAALGVESGTLQASEAASVAAFVAESRAMVSGLRTLLQAK